MKISFECFSSAGRLKSLSLNLIWLLFLSLMTSCKHEPVESKEDLLFKAAVSDKGFEWYKGSSKVLRSSAPSAHNLWFRVKYNRIASAALTDQGKLPAGGSFPEGSLVVKELFDEENGDLKLLAVMEKSLGASTAGAGWNWVEFKPDGSVFFKLASKGEGCISCHSEQDRDFNRIFDLF
jgi:hypothetical protein